MIEHLLSSIYPYTVFVVFFFISLWYIADRKLRKNKKRINIFLIISLGIHFLAFMANYDLQRFMVWWVLRDLAGMMIFIIFWRIILRYRKFFFTVMVFSVILLIYFIYTDRISINTSNFALADSSYVETGNQGEILFDISSPDELEKIVKALSMYKPEIKPAFPQIQDKDITELDNYYILDIADNFRSEIPGILETLSKLTNDAELNEVYALSPIENSEAEIDTTSISSFKQVNDPDFLKVWSFGLIESDNLYKFLLENNPVRKAKIFILDTGIDSKHEDLTDNYVSIDSRHDKDVQGHGTHCAGIASAVSNNGIGIASLNLTNKYTQITSVKVLSDGGSGTQENIVDGIILAADNGADVISMSLGGRASDKRERVYDRAIEYANKKGAIVVVAAGNESENAENHVPAKCKGAICVAAVDKNLNIASFSNSVISMQMPICAPGVDIFSTFPGNTYRSLSGTSMATPYVAGLLGLMKSINPNITTAQAYKILNNTGIETGQSDKTGMFVQPYKALFETYKKSSSASIGFKHFLIKLFSLR